MRDRVDGSSQHDVHDGVNTRGQEAGQQPEAERPRGEHKDRDTNSQPQQGTVEEPAVPGIDRNVFGVVPEVVGVGGGLLVQTDVAQLDLPEPENCRAMGVFGGVGLGVMLTVNGHPFASLLAGCDPAEEAEREGGNRVHRE